MAFRDSFSGLSRPLLKSFSLDLLLRLFCEPPRTVSFGSSQDLLSRLLLRKEILQDLFSTSFRDLPCEPPLRTSVRTSSHSLLAVLVSRASFSRRLVAPRFETSCDNFFSGLFP